MEINQLTTMGWLLAVSCSTFSCGDDDSVGEDLACSEDATALFNESEGILLVEAESVTFGEGWSFVNDLSDATGSGYVRWEGEDQFGNPGEGLTSFSLSISTAGTYRFVWRNAVTEGDNPTEGNDSWLRFADADDFFGQKGDGSVVFPNGTGKSPNPEGASTEGWLKVYRSGTPLDFKWQARTSDNDAHDIYVTFNSPGTYTMEVSGRSRGHAIDKFVLFLEDLYSEEDATESTVFSEIGCN